MKEIRLFKLSIENFKGIRTLDIDFFGKNTCISGKNGTGKTSVGDAISWLLFEKDMAGTTAIEIETKTPGGEVIHNLDHCVTAEFEVNGKRVKFQRKYLEKWTKKRGNATAEFSGHVSDFFVNDVPVTKKEFDFKVSELGEPETLMRLMFLDTFANTDWKKRREIFVDFAGGISDEDIINKNEDFKFLPLDKYSIDEIKAMAQNNRKRVNKELESLPGKISVLKNELTDIDGNTENIEKEILQVNRELSLLRTRKSGLLDGGAVAEYNLKISELKKRYIDEESTYNKRVNEENADIVSRRNEVQKQLCDKEQIRDSKCDYLSQIKADRERCEKLLEGVRKKFRAEKDKEYDGTEFCPCCGQRMPEDKINEAIRKFESDKTDVLVSLRTQGKQYGNDINLLEEKRTAAENEIRLLTQEVMELSAVLEQIAIPEIVPYENKAITDEISLFENKIKEAQSGNGDEINNIESEIQSKEKIVSELHERLAAVKSQISIRGSISELEHQQTELGKLLEKEDKILFLVDEFTMAQCNALTDKINSKFENIRVKMFDIQVNGGISPCCDIISAKDGSNLTGSMNRGQTVNAKIEIINALSEHYGICTPLIVDDSEGVTNLKKTLGQAIILRHDAKLEELQIESEEK